MTEEPRRPLTEEEIKELLTKGRNMKPLEPPTLVEKPPFEMSELLSDDSTESILSVLIFILGYLAGLFTAFFTWVMTK